MGLAEERGGRAALVRPASVVDGVFDVICERLMALDIAPGARKAIGALARNLDLSQTPVREALSRLEQEGPVCKAHLIGSCAAPQLTRKQFDDPYHFRLPPEPEGAGHTARDMTSPALAGIKAAAAQMQDDGTPLDRNSRYSRFARADAHFHDAILKVAGNEAARRSLSSRHVHLHIFRLMFHVRVTAGRWWNMAAFWPRFAPPARGLPNRRCATLSSGPATA